MTRTEIASFIQRLMRRELGDGELSALTTRDLDDINTYLAERAKATRDARQSGAANSSAKSSSAQTSYTQRVEQRVNKVQDGLQAFKTAQSYSEQEILLELGIYE